MRPTNCFWILHYSLDYRLYYHGVILVLLLCSILGSILRKLEKDSFFFHPFGCFGGLFFILLSANQMVSFPILPFPKTFLIEPGAILLHPSKEEVLWLTLGGLGGVVLLWELIFRRRFNKIQNNNNLLLLGILVLTAVQAFWLDSEADKCFFYCQ